MRQGVLYLIGRLRVARVCKQAEAIAILKSEPREATDYLIAEKGTMTAMRFGRKVSLRHAKLLRFPTKTGLQPLKFFARGLLDRQTLRGVRRLDAASAKLLDRLIVRR